MFGGATERQASGNSIRLQSRIQDLHRRMRDRLDKVRLGDRLERSTFDHRFEDWRARHRWVNAQAVWNCEPRGAQTRKSRSAGIATCQIERSPLQIDFVRYNRNPIRRRHRKSNRSNTRRLERYRHFSLNMRCALPRSHQRIMNSDPSPDTTGAPGTSD